MKQTQPNYPKPAIVIPAYKRPAHLLRLLESLNRAFYPDEPVQLIISIDGGGEPDVLEAANQFSFRHGTKEVVKRERNLGLRDHILALGDLTERYGSVILLEDDLIVSPLFYNFAASALHAYSKQPEIAGISLYSQRYNETAHLPFLPLQTGFDAYFMQIPSSWGQAWSASQWRSFRNWYDSHQHQQFPSDGSLPKNVIEWPETSWKKYYNLYMIQKKRWFVYPYSSFSTGGCDHESQHMRETGNRFQVPLDMADELRYIFRLPDINDMVPFYDAYMEINSGYFKEWLKVSASDIEMDLYGSKPAGLLRRKQYSITPRKPNGDALQQFSLTYKPFELNLMHKPIAGEKSFFSLIRSEQINDKVDTNPEWIMELIHYFSGIDLGTRTFAKGFLRYVFLKKIFGNRQ